MKDAGIAIRLHADRIRAAAARTAAVYSVKLVNLETTTEADFNGAPSWAQLQEAIEKAFPDLTFEDYRVKAGKAAVSEHHWAAHICELEGTELTLTVTSLAKPFSEFEKDEMFDLLGLPSSVVLTDLQMPPGINLEESLPTHLCGLCGWQTKDQLMAHVGHELALRCFYSEPADAIDERRRTELISPVLFAAAVLTGDVEVVAEWSVLGTRARGSIDYALLVKDFAIVVVEGKLHGQLTAHLGQLAAGMRTAREQFKMLTLGKRKHEDEGEFSEVPSFGILTNGTRYRTYKFIPERKQLVLCQFVELQLYKGIQADAAKEEAIKIISRLVPLLEEHKASMRAFDAKRHKTASV